MNDFDSFRRRVRQTDDYTKHQRTFVAMLVFGFLGIVGGGVVFGTFEAGIAVMGLLFICMAFTPVAH